MRTKELHPLFRTLGIMCYLTSILYLGSQLFPNPTIEMIYSILGAILFISAFILISTINRIIVFSLVLIGSLCLYIEQTPFHTAILGFGANVNILSLFLLIPLIGTILSTAGYLSVLGEKIQAREQNKGQRPYLLSYFLTAAVSPILNYGAIPIVKRITEESSTDFQDKKITLTIMRGFGVSMLWSPYFVNVGLILVLFELSWFAISGYGMILACIYILVSWILFKFISFPDDPPIHPDHSKSHSSHHQSLIPFFTFCIVLVGLSFLLDHLLDVNMLTVVSLLSFVLPFVWSVLTRVTNTYSQAFSERVQYSFIRLKNELAIFISAGFFGMSLSQTEFGTHFSTILLTVSFNSIYLITILIVMMAILLALIGIHPVIIVIGIGSSLSPENIGVSSTYIALCLLIAWTTATQTSPFSGQVLMASRLMNEKPIIVVRQNMKFSLLLAGILTTVIYLLQVVGWL